VLAAITPVAVVGCRLLSACAIVPARTQRSRVLQRLLVTSCAARSLAVGGARGDVCHSNLQSSPADWPGVTRYRSRRCVLQHSPADWPAGLSSGPAYCSDCRSSPVPRPGLVRKLLAAMCATAICSLRWRIGPAALAIATGGVCRGCSTRSLVIAD